MLPVLVSIGLMVQMALIGHSGAKAAWSDAAAAYPLTASISLFE